MSNSSKAKDDMTVLSYNVAQIPLGPKTAERAPELVKFLGDRSEDILLLQECFLHAFQRQILSDSTIPKKYQCILPRGIGGTSYNSGLAILYDKQKYHLLAYHQPIYTCSLDVDSFSPKGFTHLKLQDKVTGRVHHVINTHTQAQYESKEYQVIMTLSQLASVAAYINQLPKEEAVILGGDLNIPNLIEDNTCIDMSIVHAMLDSIIPMACCEATFSLDNEHNRHKKEAPGELDHIFSRASQSTVTLVTNAKYGKDKTHDLSDHYPILAILKNTALEHTDSKDEDLYLEEEPLSPMKVATLLKLQRAILGEVIRDAMLAAGKKSILGWDKEHASNIYHRVCNIIYHYNKLSNTDKIRLGKGDVFRNHLLTQNLNAMFVHGTQFLMTKNNSHSLKELLQSYYQTKAQLKDLKQSFNLKETLSLLEIGLAEPKYAVAVLLLSSVCLMSLFSTTLPAILTTTLAINVFLFVEGRRHYQTLSEESISTPDSTTSCPIESQTEAATVSVF